MDTKVLNSKGKEVAKGISSVSSDSLRFSLESPIKSKQSPVVIHRDVLVLTSELIS